MEGVQSLLCVSGTTTETKKDLNKMTFDERHLTADYSVRRPRLLPVTGGGRRGSTRGGSGSFERRVRTCLGACFPRLSRCCESGTPDVVHSEVGRREETWLCLRPLQTHVDGVRDDRSCP